MADIIILIAGMGLNFAIIPTIRAASKPPLLTSVGFSICVFAIGGALLSEALWLGGAANVVGGALWGVIVIQTFLMRRRKS